MSLQELHDQLLAEGCNRFYIAGVGGPVSDDVVCLGLHNGNWEVFYVERGQSSKPIFSTTDEQEAINFYCRYVMSLEHRHLIVFTRSAQVLDAYKTLMGNQGIKTIQNDIPHFAAVSDRIFRLFVVNKDIFRAKEFIKELPFYDEELKRAND